MKALPHLVGLLTMIAGTLSVFGVVLAMNAQETPLPAVETRARAPIAFQRVEKPRSAPAPAPRPRPQPTPRPATPPPPRLGTALSGIDLGLPGAQSVNAAADVKVGGQAAAVGDMIMTEDAVDTVPRPVSRAAPTYPPRARARGEEGSVVLNLLVDARGEVQKVKVLQSTPPGVFDDAAVEAVRAWRFAPATFRGQPVRVWARQTVRFDLR